MAVATVLGITAEVIAQVRPFYRGDFPSLIAVVLLPLVIVSVMQLRSRTSRYPRLQNVLTAIALCVLVILVLQIFVVSPLGQLDG